MSNGVHIFYMSKKIMMLGIKIQGHAVISFSLFSIFSCVGIFKVLILASPNY